MWKIKHENSTHAYNNAAAQVLVWYTHFSCLLTEHNFCYNLLLLLLFNVDSFYLVNGERSLCWPKIDRRQRTHTHTHIRYQLFCLDLVVPQNSILNNNNNELPRNVAKYKKYFVILRHLIVMLMQLSIIYVPHVIKFRPLIQRSIHPQNCAAHSKKFRMHTARIFKQTHRQTPMHPNVRCLLFIVLTLTNTHHCCLCFYKKYMSFFEIGSSMSSDCGDVICIHKNNAPLGQLAHSFFASNSGIDEFFNDFFFVVSRWPLFYYYLEFSVLYQCGHAPMLGTETRFFYVHSSVHGHFEKEHSRSKRRLFELADKKRYKNPT